MADGLGAFEGHPGKHSRVREIAARRVRVERLEGRASVIEVKVGVIPRQELEDLFVAWTKTLD